MRAGFVIIKLLFNFFRSALRCAFQVIDMPSISMIVMGYIWRRHTFVVAWSVAVFILKEAFR